MPRLCGLILLAWAGMGSTARAQVVVGDVATVGFRASRTSGGTTFVCRAGQWVPIQVHLSVQGKAPFQGQLRYEAPDLDGDLVSYLETPVTATFEAGMKRAWVYAVWQEDPASTRLSGSVDILTEDGVLLSRLAVPPADLISNDTLLILDVSERPVTALRTLETPDWVPMSRGFGVRPYYRNVLVAAMPAGELPDRWFGLEAVDIVVWDRPDPSAVSLAQLDALETWVRQGGKLVVGLGDRWPAVSKSPLADWLPVETRPGSAGVTRAVERMDQFFRKLSLAGGPYFPRPVTVAWVQPRVGAWRTFRTQIDDGSAVDLIVTQWLDAGRVTAVAASLNDLVRASPSDTFYAQLFDLNPLSDAFRKSERESQLMYFGAPPRYLYDGIVAPIGFTGAGAMFVLAAFAFVVAYIGVATVGTWRWLRRHRLDTLNWVVFAVIAAVASGLSLGAVGLLHGVSRGFMVFDFVDLEAGRREAVARSYFGYSSSMRGRVALSLPGQEGFLRPLTRGPEGSGRYATPLRYEAVPKAALLRGTPLRATLKQFEGLWRGELEGTVRVGLTADRRTGKITPESWVANDLDVDLAGGYLLYVDPRLPDVEAPPSPAGYTRNWRGQEVLPGVNVLIVPIPPIPAGQRVQNLGEKSYAVIEQFHRLWRRGLKREYDRPDWWSLWDMQQVWIGELPRGPLRRVDRSLFGSHDWTWRAALLASTRTFYLHCREEKGRYEKLNMALVSTEGLMNLDVTGWLFQGRVRTGGAGEADLRLGQGVLLLLADAPGPVRLARDGEPLKPTGGRTLYRVRVPLRYTGRPPEAREDMESLP